MAKTLPASASEIAEVAEAAGQLGIAEENILSFSRTIIDLGESTNMTTEQAATEFARFANIVGMSQNDFDRLGSTIVGLGNTMATTESEIMSLSMRLAAQGSQVGMSEAQILALAGTMSSLGIQAEMGGTAMTTILKKIQSAVASGGAELEAFANAANMTSAEFKKAFEEDAVTALDALVKGLAKSSEEGAVMSEMLAELGMKGIYESDVMARLAGASDLLSESVNTATEAWDENTALATEAEQRYATTAAQLSMLKNKVVDVGITVGGILVPIVMDVVDKLGVWIDKISELDEGTLKIIMTIAGIAATIGPVLIVMGTLTNSITSLIATYRGLTSVIKSWNLVQTISTKLLYAHRTAMLAFTFAGGGVRGMITALRSGLAALNLTLLANPFVLAAAALVALGGAFYLLYQRSETFRAGIEPLLTIVKTEFVAMGQEIMTVFSQMAPVVMTALTSTIPIIIELAQSIIPLILSVVQMVFPIVLQIIQAVLPVVITLIQTVITVVLTLVQAVLPLILTVVQTVFPLVLNIIQAIIPIITTILGALVTIIQGVVVPAIQGILTVVQYVFPYIQMIIENVLAIINGIIQTAMAIIRGDWDGAWNAIKATAETIMNNIISFFQSINLFEIGKNIINGLINGIASMGGAVLEAIASLVPEPLKKAAGGIMKSLGIGAYAEGGIVTRPELALIGEGGDTEAVIPWNNSQRSKDLWIQTGRAIGMLNSNNVLSNMQRQIAMRNNTPAISPEDVSGATINRNSSQIILQYNPQYNVNNPDDLQTVQEYAERDKDDLLARLAEIQRNERRVAFG